MFHTNAWFIHMYVYMYVIRNITYTCVNYIHIASIHILGKETFSTKCYHAVHRCLWGCVCGGNKWHSLSLSAPQPFSKRHQFSSKLNTLAAAELCVEKSLSNRLSVGRGISLCRRYTDLTDYEYYPVITSPS